MSRRNASGQDVETGLFRIIQEALTNVHRHSGAEAVHIKITSSNGRLTLSIQDDGKGIPSDALRMTPNGRQGVGLSSMRERSALLGGTFNVETNRRGTLIVVSVPLQIPKKLSFCLKSSHAAVSRTRGCCRKHRQLASPLSIHKPSQTPAIQVPISISMTGPTDQR